MKWIPPGIPAVLALIALATLACGQPLTTGEQTQTAQAVVTAATPTPTVAPEATPPSPPQAVSPVALTPLTPQVAARTDCPEGWNVFRDLTSSLSFCAPALLGAVGSVDNIGGSLTTLEMAKPYMHLAVEVTPRGSFVEGVDVAKQCAIGLVPSQLSGEVVHITVAGLGTVGCHVVGLSPTGGTLEEISVTAATGLGDTSSYLNLLAIWKTQDSAKPLIDQIIGTVILKP